MTSDAFFLEKRAGIAPKLKEKGFSVRIEKTNSDGSLSNEDLFAIQTGTTQFKDDLGAPLGEYQYFVTVKDGHEPEEGDRFISSNRNEVIVKVVKIQPANIILGWTIVARTG